MGNVVRFAGLTLGIVGVAVACGTTAFSGASSTGSDAATDSPTETSIGSGDSGVASGTLTPLLQIGSAEGIFVDDTYVYYTTADYDSQTNTIGRISKSSLENSIIANGEGPAMQVVTTDDDHVFWTLWDLGVSTHTGGVRGKRATTGAATTLVSSAVPWFGAGVTSTDVIAAQFGGPPYDLSTAATPDSGTSIISFADADGGALPNIAPSHYVLDQGTLFWTDESASAIGGVYSTTTPAGGTATQLATDARMAWGLAVNADYIVYSTYNGPTNTTGAVVRLDRNGSAPLTLTDAYTAVAGVAIVGPNVYFCDNVSTVWKVPLDGSSAPVAFVNDQPGPHALATDGAALYWTNDDSSRGGVMRYQL